MSFGRLAVGRDHQAEIRVQLDRASVALDGDQGLRKVVGHLLGLVGVLDQADGTGLVAQHHRRRILAAVLGVAALRFARDVLRFTQEDAGEVEHMDADVEDGEARLLVEIGLRAIDVVAGAEGDAAPCRRADDARFQNLAQLDHRRLVAEVLLMHGERHAACLRGLDHAHAGVPLSGAKGFCTMVRDSS